MSEDIEHVLPTEVDIAAYRQRGFWLTGLVLSEEVLDQAERGMADFYSGKRDRPGPIGVEAEGWHPKHGDCLRKNDYASLRSDDLAALVAHPAIGAIAARLSGAQGIRLWHDQLLFKPVDTAAQSANVGWHTDRQYWQTCTSQEMLTAWVPFHDVNVENGSITFIDGSNHWQSEELDFFASDIDRQEANLVAAGHAVEKVPGVLKRGQVSFHHCRTIHGSGANSSTQPRRSIAIHLQPSDNQYQRHTLADGRIAHHRNDDLCRRAESGFPDYADPELCPVLWPREVNPT